MSFCCYLHLRLANIAMHVSTISEISGNHFLLRSNIFYMIRLNDIGIHYIESCGLSALIMKLTVIYSEKLNNNRHITSVIKMVIMIIRMRDVGGVQLALIITIFLFFSCYIYDLYYFYFSFH